MGLIYLFYDWPSNNTQTALCTLFILIVAIAALIIVDKIDQ